MPIDIADPRIRVASVAAVHAPLLDLAQARLAAPTEASGDEIDLALAQRVTQHLQSGEASRLAEAIAAAPSVEVARQLWRGLIDGWGLASRAAGEGVAAQLFALPVVVVAACEEGGALSAPTPSVAGVLPDAARLAAILREHRALGGTQTFALANALVAADAIDVPQLSKLLAWQNLAAGTDFAERDLPPTAIAVQPGQQTVHLRFLIGSALVVGEGDVQAAAGTLGWAMPLARELARELATPGLAVLALPRLPQSPPAALQQGLAAQREVAAQLFASNAIRKLRAETGEPAAVISAHRVAAAAGGGELRLSLSSPFDPRAAEGFRCPLFATDRASDVAAMLVETLRDCRIADVRVLPGVHPDRDPETGTALLFKANAQDAVERGSLH